MVISKLINIVRNELSDNADFEARQIIMSALKISQQDLIINAKREVSEKDIEAVQSLVSRRKSGEPLQYILGTAEFMSLEFDVTPDTLIPRADTETLVETVLNLIGNKRVSLLDIGTGTGCIGISIAHYKNAAVTLLDKSEKALEIAKKNAKKHNINARFLNMDILHNFPHEKFDIIVSNPPYIETDVIDTLQTEVKDHEPLSALDGGKDGLTFYRRIVDIAPQMLNNNGMLAFETGYNQGQAVRNLMIPHFQNVEIIKDLCGNDRVVAGHQRLP